MRRLSIRAVAVAFLTLIPMGRAAPQEAPTPRPGDTPLAVFLDCQNVFCDFDYVRTEITYVNWVRDRAVADVHILVTGEDTGAGGREFTSTFLGLRRFAGLADTLKVVLGPGFTEDERRKGLTQLFRAGLVRYVARTPAGARLTIAMSGAAASPQTLTSSDPWNAWVYRISLSGNGDGEETYRSVNVHGNLSADRITANWKTRINGYESYNQSDFELDAATTVVNIRRSYGASLLQVKSLGQHWSAGLRGSFSSSTYDNVKAQVRLYPALEYNVFPYARSTRRQTRFEYNLGGAYFAYRDTTIEDKVRESMPLQRLVVSTALKEQWGSVDVGVQGLSYLHDLAKYRISSFGEFSWRVFKGLNLNAFGQYDVIYDQFSLAKKSFTPEEILTRQFRRGSRYSYWGYLSLSYTFGSVLNNVVNPRMGSFFD